MAQRIAGDELENLGNAIAVCAAMKEEIVSRGGVYDHDTDRWVFPPKDDFVGDPSVDHEEAAGRDNELYEAEQERIHDFRKDEGLDPRTGRER
jgi:hypothetical protein